MTGPFAGAKVVPLHLPSVNPGPDFLERMLSLRLRCLRMLPLRYPHTLSIQNQPHKPIHASPSSPLHPSLPRVQDFIYSLLTRASPDLCSRYTCRSSPHPTAWALEMHEPIHDPSFLSILWLGHLSLEQWRQAAERTGWEKGQRGEGKKCSCVRKHTSLSTFKMSQHSIKCSKNFGGWWLLNMFKMSGIECKDTVSSVKRNGNLRWGPEFWMDGIVLE